MTFIMADKIGLDQKEHFCRLEEHDIIKRENFLREFRLYHQCKHLNIESLHKGTENNMCNRRKTQISLGMTCQGISVVAVPMRNLEFLATKARTLNADQVRRFAFSSDAYVH